MNDSETQTSASQKSPADWGMSPEETRGRRYEEEGHSYRNPFQRDRDRIIHSTAFRRLQYKTQVFIIHEGDYYRTRLTHTNEVSQIARTVALALDLNETLTEAIALAHDLGHTPFGHSGEWALNQKLQERDAGSFRHNRQSLRVLETLENRYPDFRGVNLTWEVRESIIKHGFPNNPTPAEEYRPDWAPLLEERVVDMADSIAYTNHDLDDGVKSGILNREELEEVALWQETLREVRQQHGELEQEVERSTVIRNLIDRMVTDLVNNTRKTLRDRNIQTTLDVRNCREPLVQFSNELHEEKQELEAFLHERMYCHHRVLRMQERAQRVVRVLFDEFFREPRLLPGEYREWAERVGKPRGIADYIAGMTDRYALDEYEEIIGPLP